MIPLSVKTHVKVPQKEPAEHFSVRSRARSAGLSLRPRLSSLRAPPAWSPPEAARVAAPPVPGRQGWAGACCSQGRGGEASSQAHPGALTVPSARRCVRAPWEPLSGCVYVHVPGDSLILPGLRFFGLWHRQILLIVQVFSPWGPRPRKQS